MGGPTSLISFHGDSDENDTVGFSIELSVFKPKESGKQVHMRNVYDCITFILTCFVKFASLILKVGRTFANPEENIFESTLTMKEVVLTHEWHSFCLILDMVSEQFILFHNGKVQAVQNLKSTLRGEKGIQQFLTKGKFASNKFLGSYADIQIFSYALPEDKIYQWSICNNEVVFR